MRWEHIMTLDSNNPRDGYRQLCTSWNSEQREIEIAIPSIHSSPFLPQTWMHCVPWVQLLEGGMFQALWSLWSLITLSLSLPLQFSWRYQLACATSPWIVCYPLSVFFHCPHLCNKPLIKLSSVKSQESVICHSWKPVRRIFDIYFLKSLILMPWFLICVSLLSLTAA